MDIYTEYKKIVKRMSKEDKSKLKILEQAAVCCMPCGRKYGVYSVGCSSVWNGTCRVCGEQTQITETRDFAYLIKGRREIFSRYTDAQQQTSNG